MRKNGRVLPLRFINNRATTRRACDGEIVLCGGGHCFVLRVKVGKLPTAITMSMSCAAKLCANAST